MAKLYFRYGAMGAAKTLNLLAVAHNYRKQGKKVYLIKPAIDTRSRTIASRAGLEVEADLVIGPGESFDGTSVGDVSCVLVDEAQFLTTLQIETLRVLSTGLNIPVICYGLRTDYQCRLFPGSRRLMELADSIEEIKTTCQYCERKATQNLRLVESDDQVVIGGDEAYAPACFLCFALRTPKAAKYVEDLNAVYL